MFASIILSWKIANKNYDKAMYQKNYFIKTEKNKKSVKRIIVAIIILVIAVILLGIVRIGISFEQELSKVNSKKVVATQLTQDDCFGPMVMDNIVYMPIRGEIELKEEKEIGLFTYQDEDASDLLYGLFFSNFVYVDATDTNKTYCVAKGSDYHSYVRADFMEEKFDLGEYKKFVALDTGFLDKQAWDDDDSRVGIHDVDNALFEELENLFGIVEYRAEEFEQIDTYYAIIGTKENYVKQDEWDSETNFYLNNSDVIGCILVKDGKYYYGSLENLIPEELSLKVKTMLATNEK
jgi:hypothetical protein